MSNQTETPVAETATATGVSLSHVAQHLPDILTEREVIDYLRLDGLAPQKTLYRLRQRGRIKSFRIGREVKYRREDVLAFVAWQHELHN